MSEVKIKSKFVLITIAAAVILMLTYFFLPNEERVHSQDLIEIQAQKTITESKLKTLPSNKENTKQIVKNIQQTSLLNEQEVSDEFTTISRLSDKAHSVLEEAGVLPRDIVGANAAYLEFDLDSLRALEVGGTFDLEIPQTQEIFTAEVTDITKFPNGDKNIVGTVIGQGGDFHTTVITVGKDAMYGQFTTISGNWVFESKDQYGWMASKRDLYKSHVEFAAVPSGSTVSGVDDPLTPKTKN